ncbi:hypothetical protein AMELA_G00262700 [Ameiurus melas]|uniref:Uncharacterized protein n=1 Tax=Ameiurus melas TaxID=219545 RepID=A0A7J5ZPA1_AMEME|nr:hypothetical protein AMELA_G00262700 [Ameiurus melas]
MDFRNLNGRRVSGQVLLQVLLTKGCWRTFYKPSIEKSRSSLNMMPDESGGLNCKSSSQVTTAIISIPTPPTNNSPNSPEVPSNPTTNSSTGVVKVSAL